MDNLHSQPKLSQVLFDRKMLVCLFTGFASGLPLYFLFQLIPAWLRGGGVDLTTIGLFAIVTFPYNWKFVWSPLMERYTPPFLGRRRGWMLITQIPLILIASCLVFLSPQTDLTYIVIIVSLISFLSASQDIVLDAYRREILSDLELGMGNTVFVNAYKFSSLVPGGLSLIIQDLFSWQAAISVAVLFLLVGLLTTLFIRESKSDFQPHTLQSAIIEPFKEFFNRKGWREASLILLFLVLYKLGDNMAVALETPFFYDMGFSGTEIGTIAKFSKLAAAIVGSIIGGVMLTYLGIYRCLWIFGFFQIFSILGYAALAWAGHDLWVLFTAVSLEYLGVGLGTVGVSTYMAKITSLKFTATQFALLSSIAAIPRTLASASTGIIIDAVGYFMFFIICFACAIPGMLLLLKIAPWNKTDTLEQHDG